MSSTKNKLVAVLAVVLIFAAGYLVAAGLPFGPRTTYAAPALFNEDSITAIYDNVSSAVVEIRVTETGTGIGRSLREGQGSGFLVNGQGHILTNNHVVDGATTVQVIFKDGSTTNASVIGTDPSDDLALIGVEPSTVTGVTPLQLADSSTVKPGQMAIALGSPYGLTETITVGVVSGLNRSIGGGMTGMIQTDAAINPGNSGGQVIGINTAIESAQGARGIGFAVPSNVATRVLPSLQTGSAVTRPWLGISGIALTRSISESLGLSEDRGVYVGSVVAGSPADKAGIKAGSIDAQGNPTPGGDVITWVDGRAVGSVQDLSSYFNTKQVGDKVTLSVLREGQTIKVEVTLGTWPSSTPQRIAPQIPLPLPNIPMPWDRHFRGAVPTPVK